MGNEIKRFLLHQSEGGSGGRVRVGTREDGVSKPGWELKFYREKEDQDAGNGRQEFGEGRGGVGVPTGEREPKTRTPTGNETWGFGTVSCWFVFGSYKFVRRSRTVV